MAKMPTARPADETVHSLGSTADRRLLAPGASLANFFSALAQLESGRRQDPVRVLHYGDSSTGVDGLPHAIRSRLQRRFGDGGAGFALPKRYSASYRPRALKLSGDERWTHCYIAYKCRKDGHYGLGGVVFSSTGGAKSTWSTLRKGETGRSIARGELWYQAFPGGGRLELRDGKQLLTTIDSRSSAQEDRWFPFELPAGAHHISVRAAGHGKSRVYGITLESGTPGVVWDTMTMTGAFTKRLLAWNPDHIARQISHREPELIVFTYGGNDLRRLVAGKMTGETYYQEFDQVIKLVRKGRPAASCLVTSVIDHGRSGHWTVKARHVEEMVGAQRRVALDNGCAFFDSYAAMGGAGSIHRWRKQGLASPDLKHLSGRGREKMGAIIFDELMALYGK